MKKNFNIIILLVAFMMMFCITACDHNAGDNKNDDVVIGEKTDKPYLDYVWLSVSKVGLEFNDLLGNTVNVIEVNVIKNYNELLNEETDYSNYVKNINENNQTLKLIVSDTYCKYLSVGDEFIYKLNEVHKLKIEDKEEEVFTTLGNEYTLLPVVGEKLCLTNITSSITFKSEPDYEMDIIFIQRDAYYGHDLDSYFVEFDYSIGYPSGGYSSYILVYNPTLSRFESILKALSNENENYFYKMKYSYLSLKPVNDPSINIEIDEYLKELGGN